MNYAWEAILQAEKHGKDRDSFRFVEAENPSPYMEVSREDLNLESPDGEKIEINPLYRFGDVFGRLFDRNTEGYEQTREIFFDVCMHYTVQLDLREGLSKEDYYYRLLEEDLSGGIYGTAGKERFRLFDRAGQKTILQSCLHLLETGNYLEGFRMAVMGLYPHAFLYENNETALELLVYLGIQETEEEREKAAFLREMFLPLQETVYFFYGHHFGIIGVEETMGIGEMVLF